MIRLGPKTSEFENNANVVSTATGCDVTNCPTTLHGFNKQIFKKVLYSRAPLRTGHPNPSNEPCTYISNQYLHFSNCARHPCAGTTLLFSVSPRWVICASLPRAVFDMRLHTQRTKIFAKQRQRTTHRVLIRSHKSKNNSANTDPVLQGVCSLSKRMVSTLVKPSHAADPGEVEEGRQVCDRRKAVGTGLQLWSDGAQMCQNYTDGQVAKTRKFSGAGVILLGSHRFFLYKKASTRKQKTTARSSAEAELYAAALGT